MKILKANLYDYFENVKYPLDNTKEEKDETKQERKSYENDYVQKEKKTKELSEKEIKYLKFLDIRNTENVTFNQIKMAYKKQMKDYHPDLYKNVDEKKIAEEVSEKINEAYNFFKKKEKKFKKFKN